MRNFLTLIVFTLFSIVNFAQISPGKLSRAHSKLEGISNCTKCHVLQNEVDNKKCLDCHKEIKTLIDKNLGYHSSHEVKGKNCVQCHGEHFGREFKLIKFNPDNFNHKKETTFDLTGKHSRLKCNDCYQKKFINSPKLKNRNKTYLGLSTDCLSCHEDFHQGTFKKQKCVSCHNTESWRHAPFFNHSKTKFKLEGAHKKVECEKCHPKTKLNGKDFQKFSGIKFAKCTDCHKDIHNGKFGKNCLKCHTVSSFRNTGNLKNFDHSKTGYILKGKHKNVACNDCHKTGYKKKLKYQFCTDCHKDAHSGQFIENGKIEDCAHCHTENGFIPSTFSIERHQKTNFILEGSHLAIPCSECHLKNGVNVFKFQNNNCITCHKNIHGKLIENYSSNNQLCIVCHNVTSWNNIKFDHSRTEFLLTGKHKEVKCSKCHFTNKKDLNFVKLSSECKDCHKDIHNGQFKSDYGNKCSVCHVTEDWAPNKFDHNKTRFKLDGVHSKLECAQCHKTVIINGKKQIKYKFKDKEILCKTCHA